MVLAGNGTASASSLFLQPNHSLAAQTFREPFAPFTELSPLFNETKHFIRNNRINQDGWGLAWLGGGGSGFQTHRTPAPATVLGEPSQELRRVAQSVRGSTILGHIRAATTGGNKEVNSHPFLLDRLAWMHNGAIADSDAFRAAVLRRLPDDLAAQVLGSTDSEAAGALFAWKLRQAREEGLVGSDAMGLAMRRTLGDIASGGESSPGREGGLLGPFGSSHQASSLNFAVSDGATLVVTRFRNSDAEDPPSLYLAWHGGHTTRGSLARNLSRECGFEAPHPSCPLVQAQPLETFAHTVMVASEPLDRENGQASPEGPRWWTLLPKDSMAIYESSSQRLAVSCLSAVCESRRMSEAASLW